MSVVAGIAGTELGKDAVAIRTPEDAVSARSRVEHLLKRSLTADGAVQIALLNNRGLQAAYNELGVAEALMVEASLPPNPQFTLQEIGGIAEFEIERRIITNILALATLPARAAIAADRFHQAQLHAAEETLRLAAETRRHYLRAVAARELVGFLTQANASAEAAAKLGRALGETGAMNKLDQAREQVFYADLTTQLARARQRALSARERLIHSLGLWGSDLDFKLASALPAPPARPRSWPMVERNAIERRVDLQIGRLELLALAKSYGLTQASRFVNLLELTGIEEIIQEKITPEKIFQEEEKTLAARIRNRGYRVAFEIPIFDFGEARVRKAEQAYMIAANRLAQRAVAVRSEARATYQLYRSTYDIAAHYQREVLPLRKIISDESLRQYNTMQIDVFPLLDEARRRVLATSAAIEAKRDFWLATTDLQVALLGGGGAPGEPNPAAELEQLNALQPGITEETKR
ncbi:TolC family protein [Methylocystis sp.]|uniref:TolC family protein n=1 Tax=Methylocystis sp. TaxID=1911079 RepID=UPI002600C1E9|nr:TolC family protein [Methylocystis sp.]